MGIIKIKQYLTLKNVLLFIVSLIGGVLFGYGIYKYLSFLSTFQILFLFILLGVGIYAVRSLEISFFLFLSTLPLNSVGAFYIGSSIKLWYIFLLFFLLSIVYNIQAKKQQREVVAEKIKTVLDIPLLLFFCIVILSVFQSQYVPPNPPLSWPKVIYYPWIEGIVKILILGGCFSIYYGMQYLLDTKEKIKKCVYSYGILGVILAFYGIFALVWYLTSGSLITLFNQHAVDHVVGDIPRVVGTEKEPVFFGLYLMTALPVFYALCFVQPHEKEKQNFYNRKMLLRGSFLLTLALFGTSSRSAILGFICSLFALFFLFKEERTYVQYSKEICRRILSVFSSKKTKTIVILLLLVSAVFGMVHKEQVSEGIQKTIIVPIVGTFDKDYGKFWSTKTRVIASTYAIDAWKQHPWLGIGYEGFNFYSGNNVYHGIILANVRWAEVNNYPLKVLTELGIVGFFSFLFLLGTLFFYIIRAIKRTTNIFLQTLLRGYLASFVGVGIILLFSSVIILPYLWVNLGIVVAIIREIEKEHKEEIKQGITRDLTGVEHENSD